MAEALQQGVPPAKLRRRSSRESGVEQLLKGKVAIITGGASGMGKAASILFAREGANVVVADLNTKGGEEVAAEAGKSGNRCVFHRTDVSDEAQVKALVARAVSEFGGLDLMFNNAGIGGAVGPLEEISVEDWDKTQAVCLRGVFLGIKHAVGAMRARGGGAIVNTASIAGVWGYPMLHAYCAAKAGVVNL
ncbi:MAG: SDR family NAD(P)-dependent oxidoreductase, partial [Alphaproteobacteria bacterium]|nr:SDR family NAD(P)-dependent oxidoreductase [Alphaproteobacteria bacterium]